MESLDLPAEFSDADFPLVRSPKDQMIHFLKHAIAGDNYIFMLPNCTTNDAANNYIHRMRVELSRMRNAVKEAGYIPKKFQVKLVEIKILHDEYATAITLRKVESAATEIQDQLVDVFDNLVGGQKIEVE